jgi:hypothetical protein
LAVFGGRKGACPSSRKLPRHVAVRRSTWLCHTACSASPTPAPRAVGDTKRAGGGRTRLPRQTGCNLNLRGLRGRHNPARETCCAAGDNTRYSGWMCLHARCGPSQHCPQRQPSALRHGCARCDRSKRSVCHGRVATANQRACSLAGSTDQAGEEGNGGGRTSCSLACGHGEPPTIARSHKISRKDVAGKLQSGVCEYTVHLRGKHASSKAGAVFRHWRARSPSINQARPTRLDQPGLPDTRAQPPRTHTPLTPWCSC